MNKEKQIMINFRELFNKMAWLNKFKMEGSFKDYKSSEVHYIECIGRNVDSNVTKLAESLYMTRGAISKMTKKLIKKGVIESYQKPDNKKEIYFRLTSVIGYLIFDVRGALWVLFAGRIIDGITGETISTIIECCLLILFFIAGMFIFGFGDSIFGPSFNGMLSKSVDSSEQGRIQGGSQSIQALARMIGPIIGGQIYVSCGHASPSFMGMILIATAIPVLYKSTHIK